MKTEKVLAGFVFLILISYAYLGFSDFWGELSITGQPIVGTRLVIVQVEQAACNFTLVENWNLISFPCLGVNPTAIDLTLSNISGKYESIKTYLPADTSDPWKSYNPSLPAWVIQDLTSISKSRGYWLDMSDNSSYYLNSSLATPTLFEPDPGWNLLGYPSKNITEVNLTCLELIPNYTYVYMYNATENDWKEFTWNASLPSNQDLTHTVPNFGYWIYVTTKEIFSIS